MAAPLRHDSLAQTREYLRRARAAGATFEEAWPQVQPSRRADAPIRWTRDPTELKAWRVALAATEDAWRRAFEHGPVLASDQAVRALAEVLAETDEGLIAA